jgi:hypothetical protein
MKSRIFSESMKEGLLNLDMADIRTRDNGELLNERDFQQGLVHLWIAIILAVIVMQPASPTF